VSKFPGVADVTLHAAVALLVDSSYDAMERVRTEFVEAYGVGVWPPPASRRCRWTTPSPARAAASAS